MARLPKLKYVKFTRSKGKVYAYFDTGRKKSNGEPIRLPLPPYGTVGFYDSYSSFLGARTKRMAIVPTIASVAELYQNSDDFKDRSEGTKKVYRITLKKVLAEFGEFPLEDVTRKRVYDVLDEIPGPASRNLFVAMLGVLFRYARSRDMTEANPIKDIRQAKTGEHEPWPDDLLTAALAADEAMIRLSVHLLNFTGQRLGDVLKLRWSDIRGGNVVMTQQKTAKPMIIRMHRDLIAELDQAPRLGMTIISHATGKPVGADFLRNLLKGFAAKLGHSVVPHGLRKNAVNSLLRAGCTIPEVQAITGQSVEMVMHYAKQVDQGALSEAAIIKLERGNRS
ncbi:tyrosine-type recombinase/integrase [Novosphingobium sp. RL4]|uniref:tyrosine-type recombinase/integrase n=1 Tax=Novosphingobium sp. RL4 TaxID=3109595 RepID=UPI002D76A8C9|nr:tyrosine-type recombinase/integrase [Novosphingobium sp. RL4]WRT91869.1 tyrosine-type recombinase/integrase [Novosphingobium sp. RL4]